MLDTSTSTASEPNRRIQITMALASPALHAQTSGAHQSPGLVWAERYHLDPHTKRTLDREPVIKIHQGEVKISDPHVDKLKDSKDATTATLLDRFRAAVMAISIPVCNSPIPQCDRTNLKRKRESGDAGDAEDAEAGRSSSELLAKMDTGAPLVVPIGASAGDRITFYDNDRMVLTHEYVTIPADAYDGMPIPNSKMPTSECRLLIVDGEEFAVGGKMKQQHGVRLHVHRKHCKDPFCRVLGCSSQAAFYIFKNQGTHGMRQSYEAHWGRSKRVGLQRHGRICD